MEKQVNIPKLRFPEFNGEWEKKKLGEIAEVKTGNKDTQNRVEDGLYPFFVRSNTVEKINTYSFDGEAILTSGDGVGVGKNFHYVVGKFDFHQRVYSIRNFKNGYSGKYIFNIFSEKFYSRVIRLSAKNSVDSVRMEMITEMDIHFPSLQEQTKIASFLTAVDDKLQALKKKKQLLEQYKKGVMQKIFSQELRFKDENGNDYPDWEEKKLGELANKKSSNISANKIEDNFGDYIIYGASGILKKVDFYKEENDYISIVKDGAGVGRLLYCKGQSSVLGTMEIIRPNEGINTYYLYCLLSNIDFVKYVTGSTIPHIYFKDYSIEICGLPCLQEQTKIATFLSVIDDKINHCQSQIEKTEVWKKGLLQQMFC